MRRNNVLSREKAANAARVRAEIGRRLRDEYDTTQPLPERLADLVGQIEGQPRLQRENPANSGFDPKLTFRLSAR